jgi:hypothetical protein
MSLQRDEVTRMDVSNTLGTSNLCACVNSSSRDTADEHHFYRGESCCCSEDLGLACVRTCHGDSKQCGEGYCHVYPTPCSFDSVEHYNGNYGQERSDECHNELVESSKVDVIVDEYASFFIRDSAALEHRAVISKAALHLGRTSRTLLPKQ